ncbi:potassium channel family protein [Halorussus gelatinilyticus]|uniref:Potassium channel family protein n=1 Tax=Halorussus gelatinilyticus TaxID=2937524 RepID=A0A8U0IHA8_9EURY|nr:ion channel [Halorussus gelatinilyticus]UPW00095.1 potassium channel family protein [Halorussus gelatinilyticus]
MNVLYLGLGSILLLGTVGDLLWTTLWVEGGAGPLTTRLMEWTWRALSRGNGGRSRVLNLAGPVILVLSLVVWLVSIWTGWTLIFAGGEDAVFDTIRGGPLSWSDLSYFAGYTMFTLGNGGFAPRDGVWQFATVLATASGMLFVTLTVTYVLSVLDAVAQKHAFASGVTGLGTDASTVVTTYWNGEEFDGLDLQLDTFSSQIDTLTANHKAYPVLHYFHSRQATEDPAVAIAVLDETLTLLRFGLPERARPSEALLKGTRSGIRSYLDALLALHRPSDRDPPAPDLARVREAGLSTVSDDEFAESLADCDVDERRRLLLAVVESNARRWPSRNDE